MTLEAIVDGRIVENINILNVTVRTLFVCSEYKATCT